MKVKLTRKKIYFSHDAKNLWLRLHNEIENDMKPGGSLYDVKDYGSKLAENIARVAALFHHFEQFEGDISAETLERAIRVCYWYTDEFIRIFSQSQIPQEVVDANILENFLVTYCIQTNSLEPIRLQYLLQEGPHSIRKRDRRNAALNVLARQGKLTVMKIGRKMCVMLNQNYFASAMNGMLPHQPQAYQGWTTQGRWGA